MPARMRGANQVTRRARSLIDQAVVSSAGAATSSCSAVASTSAISASAGSQRRHHAIARKANPIPKRQRGGSHSSCGFFSAAAFSNPFGRKNDMRGKYEPLMGVHDLYEPKDFPRLAAKAVRIAQEKMEKIRARGYDMDAKELIQIVDDISSELCDVADAAELCRNVHPDEKWVDQANEAVNIVADYMSVVNLDVKVYKILVDVEGRATGLTEEETRVLAHMRESMANEGVGIEGEGKEECLQLQQLENKLSFELSGGVDEGASTSSSSTSKPKDLDYWVPVDKVLYEEGSRILSNLERRKGTGAFMEVNLNTSNLGPYGQSINDLLLRKLSNSQYRKHIFSVQNVEDPEAEERLVQLLNVRQRLGQIRGYDNWNAYAQRDSILGGPRNVRSFLRAAWDGLLPGLEEELKILGALKKEQMQQLSVVNGAYKKDNEIPSLNIPQEDLSDNILRPWDIHYYMQKHKQASAKDLSALAPYLSYRTLMRGVNDILEHIGVKFRREDPSPCEVWHLSVEKYVLTTAEGSDVCGVLYVDPTARPEKRVQSAQFTLKGSKTFGDGGRQTPRTALICSLPTDGSGMSPLAATTFMHEVGHCVHSLLSETKLQHLSGTRGAVDFVEFPSHLFEYYVMDPEALSMYLKKGEMGKMVNDPKLNDALDSFRKTRHMFGHVDATQQLLYALVDQEFYSCPLGVDAQEMHQSIREGVGQFSTLDKVVTLDGEFTIPNDKKNLDSTVQFLLSPSALTRFEHLVHYGGSYYCYLLNKVLSCHIWRHAEMNKFSEDLSGRSMLNFFKKGSTEANFDTINALLPPKSPSPAMLWNTSCSQGWDINMDCFIKELKS